MWTLRSSVASAELSNRVHRCCSHPSEMSSGKSDRRAEAVSWCLLCVCLALTGFQPNMNKSWSHIPELKQLSYFFLPPKQP